MRGAADVSVVVPVYRHSDTLRELHRRLVASLDGQLRELVLVDDGCPERSLEVITDLARMDARVRAVALAENSGQHRAVLQGLRHATGAWTVVLDGDLQDPPEAIPQLLERARRGDVAAVFAGRRGRYESLPRLLTSKLYKRLLGALVGVPSDAGMFVVVSRPLVDTLTVIEGPAPSLVAMIGCVGGRATASVPVQRAARSNGRSAYSATARVRSALQAFRWIVWWRTRGASR